MGWLYNILVMRLNFENAPSDLDAVFSALADPTRRAILCKLSDGQATAGELAAPFEITQPAVSRHLKVLEQAGLIERFVDEQRRPARLKGRNLAAAVAWLEEFSAFWQGSFDQLDGVLEAMKQDQKKEDGIG